jgi:3-oxoacyl-ACP reductase-like protein
LRPARSAPHQKVAGSLGKDFAMANTIDLAGRHAVVTGGAQGIGRAIVERLLESGASVRFGIKWLGKEFASYDFSVNCPTPAAARTAILAR